MSLPIPPGNLDSRLERIASSLESIAISLDSIADDLEVIVEGLNQEFLRPKSENPENA